MHVGQLFFRVAPHPGHESLIGYLMRVAEKNYLTGPAAVLQAVFGTRDAPLLRDADQLADYCRCSQSEILRLIGFWRHAAADGRHLYVAGQWVTKDQFDAARFPAVCPLCLEEETYLRGIWDFSLYTTCHAHAVRLVWRCYACSRRLTWTRRLVTHCSCGADLRRSPAEPGTESSCIAASLIAQALDPSVVLNGATLKNLTVVQRLTTLTLDGLFKGIWLLGHLIPLASKRGNFHGRAKPSRTDAEAIIERAFHTLRFWPTSIVQELQRLKESRTNTEVDTYLANRLSAIRAYFSADEEDASLSFLRVAFEQAVTVVWRERHVRRDRESGGQLELDLLPGSSAKVQWTAHGN